MTDRYNAELGTSAAYAITLLSALPDFALRISENNVGVEQIHQDKSAGRCKSTLRRGGSKSMCSTPGIANMSTILTELLAGF